MKKTDKPFHPNSEQLDRVFSALSDPVRREILERLDKQELLVSELAEPFDMSLQAVSKHIQVLVKAGLIVQERSGRHGRIFRMYKFRPTTTGILPGEPGLLMT